MRRAQVQREEFWTAIAAWAVWLMMILAAFFAGGAIARSLGFPPYWGSLAALGLIAIANQVTFLVQEWPRQGTRSLFRVLMLDAFMLGCLALIWSAMQIEYGQWAIVYGSLHVLLAIGLVLLLGWVSAGRDSPWSKDA